MAACEVLRHHGGGVAPEGIGSEHQPQHGKGEGTAQKLQVGGGVVFPARVGEHSCSCSSEEGRAVEFVCLEIHRIDARQKQRPGQHEVEADQHHRAPKGDALLIASFHHGNSRTSLFLGGQEPWQDKRQQHRARDADAQGFGPCKRQTEHHACRRPRPRFERVVRSIQRHKQNGDSKGNPHIGGQTVHDQRKHNVQRHGGEAVVGPCFDGLLFRWGAQQEHGQQHRDEEDPFGQVGPRQPFPVAAGEHEATKEGQGSRNGHHPTLADVHRSPA